MRVLNLGVLAHVDAGKTTLTERLLVEAGVLDEPGSVDSGSTHTDTMALERRRGITIRAAVVSFHIDDVVVNLVDTPGHSDFIAEVERSLAVLDGAVLVVSAVEGVQAQTLVLMRALQRLDIPVVVFVNKTDRVGADVEFVTLEVHERLAPDVPVLSGSAVTGDGVRELMASLPRLLPVRSPSAEGPPTGRIFAVQRDDRGAKSVYVHLSSGRLDVRSRLDLGRGAPEKVTGLRVFRDGELVEAASGRAGEIVVVRGIESARIGDAFGTHDDGVERQFARPSLATVVSAVHERDRGTLYTALTQLAEQDPLIDLRQDDDRRELRLSLYGEVQKEVLGALLAEEYGVAVTFRESTVICVERLIGTGQHVEEIATPTNPYLATVGLRVEPAPVGAGVTFGLEVELGAMPRAFFAAVETAVRSTLEQGRYGWEIPDCHVVMTHAGYWARQSHSHGTFDKSMSSTAGDFRNLTRLVLATAIARAGTAVCEPVHRFDVEVPEASLSGVLAVLSQVGAVPLDIEPAASVVHVTGEVPAGAVHDLTGRLPGVSGGEGVLTTTPDHYRPVVGRPPTRERTDHDPFDREVYLRRVTRSTTT